MPFGPGAPAGRPPVSRRLTVAPLQNCLSHLLPVLLSDTARARVRCAADHPEPGVRAATCPRRVVVRLFPRAGSATARGAPAASLRPAAPHRPAPRGLHLRPWGPRVR